MSYGADVPPNPYFGYVVDADWVQLATDFASAIRVRTPAPVPPLLT
jgi:hypothetical protein